MTKNVVSAVSKQNTMIKSVSIVMLLVFFLVSGCKGKEEKQIVSGIPSPEQQEKVVPSPSQQVLATEPSSSSPDVMSDTPPKVTSLKVSPEAPLAGDKIKAEAATFDKEGDNVFLTYYWTKNGVPISETSDTLTLSGDFKRGDKIGLTVVPDDGKRKGNPASLTIFVANALPVIKPSTEPFRFNGKEYTLQIKASDPEGDTLAYSLKSAPPGMTIDPKTGLIKWNVPPEFKGNASFTVAINDGHGGEVLQSFTLEITPEMR